MPARPTIVAVLGITIALVISLALTDRSRPATGMPAVPAGRYVAASGERSFLTDPYGNQTIIETSLLPGAVAFSDAPTAFQSVLGNFGLDWAAEAFWIWETSELPDGTAWARLYSLTAEGLVMHAYQRGDPADGVWLDEGLVELPSDPQPGERWTSIGRALTLQGDAFDYTREGSIQASQLQGCLDITLTDDLAGFPQVTTLTRCPGEGIVGLNGLTSTEPPDTGLDGLSLAAPMPAPLSGDPAEVAVLAGEVPISLGMTTAPVALGSGMLFANRVNGHLVFTEPADQAGDWPIKWRRRPGEHTLALLGAGELAIAATLDRTLVAYDADGRWRWQSTTDDLVAQLALLDEQSFITLGLDGTLSVRSLTDGTQLQHSQVASGASLPMAVDDRRIAVAAGRMLSIVHPDGQVHNQALAAGIGGLAWVDGQLVVVDHEATLSVFDPGGERAWQLGLPDTCLTTLSLDGMLVCASSTTIRAISISERQVTWQQPIAALGVAEVARQLLVTGRQHSWLLDADGTQLAQWQAARASSQHWVVPLESGLLVISPDGNTDWWAAP